MKLARRISALADPALKRALISNEIDDHPAEFVEVLEEVAKQAELGDSRSKEVLLWVANVLGEDAERSQALRVLADGRGLVSVSRMLWKRKSVAAPPPTMTGPPVDPIDDPRRAGVLSGREGRPLTLGERRSLAAMPSRKDFEKVLRDPNPMVMDRLLKNPRLTEEDVMRIVVRRPNNADVLREVAKNAKWSHRVMIRQALVLNPDTPTDITLPLAPLLLLQELLLAADTPGLPIALRSLCGELAARKRTRDDENPTVH